MKDHCLPPRCLLIALSLLLSPVGGALAAASSDCGGGPQVKKLIAVGWDSPDPESLLKNLKQMETTPFDGVAVRVQVKGKAGEEADFQRAFNGAPWKPEWFGREIETLGKVRSGKLTDNFLLMGPGPASDWFDDVAWAQVVEHFRLAARIAKQSGLKGILFDPELGVSRQPAFHYKDQIHKQDHPFSEYTAKVRQRGREAMTAMAAEYPDMTFFTLFLHTGMALGAMDSDPREGIEAKGYSLYPAFINGWLDVLPPGMTVIDGSENAYPHSTELQYLKRANGTRNLALALVAPENHAKYRSQVRLSIALYMDAFVNFPKSNVHADVLTDPPLNGSTVAERLQDATMLAREVSDGYVWLWSEQYRWWPTEMPMVKPQGWDEILPGASEALRKGMDPEESALARAGKEFDILEEKAARRKIPMSNLIKNGDFNNGAPNTKRPTVARNANGAMAVKESLAAWSIVRPGKSGGTVEGDVAGCAGWGSVRISNAKDGACAQTVETAPYLFYKFRAKVRQMGKGTPQIRLRWLDAAGDRLPGEEGQLNLAPAQSPREGWAEAACVVKAPAEATGLTIELAAKDQETAGDVIWYDDAELYRIDTN